MSRMDQKEEYFDLPARHEKDLPEQHNPFSALDDEVDDAEKGKQHGGSDKSSNKKNKKQDQAQQQDQPQQQQQQQQQPTKSKSQQKDDDRSNNQQQQKQSQQQQQQHKEQKGNKSQVPSEPSPKKQSQEQVENVDAEQHDSSQQQDSQVKQRKKSQNKHQQQQQQHHDDDDDDHEDDHDDVDQSQQQAGVDEDDHVPTVSSVEDIESALYQSEITKNSRRFMRKGRQVMYSMFKLVWNIFKNFIWVPFLAPIVSKLGENNRFTTFIADAYELIVTTIFGNTVGTIVKWITRAVVSMAKFAFRMFAYGIIAFQYMRAFIRGKPPQEADAVKQLFSPQGVNNAVNSIVNTGMKMKDAGVKYATLQWNKLTNQQPAVDKGSVRGQHGAVKHKHNAAVAA